MIHTGFSFRLSLAWLIVATGASSWAQTDELPPPRARLGTYSKSEFLVLGLEEGHLRLRPLDTDTGELLLPLGQTRDLVFVLPDAYERAQSLVLTGRMAEALPLLREVVSPLLNYLAAPGTNAQLAAELYLDALVRERQWRDAAGVIAAFPLAQRRERLGSTTLAAARGLRAAGETEVALQMIRPLLPAGNDGAFASAVLAFADESRRQGRLDEARTVYQELGELADPETERRRRLLIAYTLLQSGSFTGAREGWQQCEQPSADATTAGLYWLIAGALAMHDQRRVDAFDALSRGVVDANGAAEWRPELLRLLAENYDGAGRARAAEAIRSELARFYGPGPRIVRDVSPADSPQIESGAP